MQKKSLDIVIFLKIISVLILSATLFFIGGCKKKETVKKDAKVKIMYVGTFDDGSVFDKSKDGQPLEFVAGNGKVIPGLDKAIIGMDLNESKKINIDAKDAYGMRDETLIREMPLSNFPDDLKPEIGKIIRLQDQKGGIIACTILEVKKESIMLDFNHPLAGKNLNFDIKLVGIN